MCTITKSSSKVYICTLYCLDCPVFTGHCGDVVSVLGACSHLIFITHSWLCRTQAKKWYRSWQLKYGRRYHQVWRLWRTYGIDQPRVVEMAMEGHHVLGQRACPIWPLARELWMFTCTCLSFPSLPLHMCWYWSKIWICGVDVHVARVHTIFYGAIAQLSVLLHWHCENTWMLLSFWCWEFFWQLDIALLSGIECGEGKRKRHWSCWLF